MGNVGRYFCVALPFILTVASIVTLLIVGLTGVSSNDLYLFRLDISNLSVDSTKLQDFVNNASATLSNTDLAKIISENAEQVGNDVSNEENGIKNAIVSRSPIEWHDPSLLNGGGGSGGGSEQPNVEDVKASGDGAINSVGGAVNSITGANITAADLGLAKIYDYTLWGYCTTPQEGKRNCTKAQFDWASKELNLDWVRALSEQSNLNITVPRALDVGLDLYKSINKWTEVVFIIALVLLALEVLVGLFSACSRGVSCVTWIISGFATTALIATAVLLTVTASIITGAFWTVSNQYGGEFNINTTFLAVLWISVAFAIGASLFWVLSICCCKPEHRRSRHVDGEKQLPVGAYAPLDENRNSSYNSYNYGAPPQRGGARSDLAYEPYSHARA